MSISTVSQHRMHSFDTTEVLDHHLANDVADYLQQSIHDKGQAVLAVSGGSTPQGFFTALRIQAIDWAKVWVTLVDERWVEPEHVDSNTRLVKEYLLQEKAAQAKFISLKVPGDSPDAAMVDVHMQLSQLPFPITVTVLGMGSDGHTASFFAGSGGLKEALAMEGPLYCQAVTSTSIKHQRMTLTLPVLLDSDKVIIHITGKQKQKLLDQALKPGSVFELPVRTVLHSNTSVDIYWAP